MVASLENVANKSFDYIITTGLTLAGRLSEDPKTSVLVLEAGEANLDDPNILRPALHGTHFGNKAYSWDYQTIKQKYVNDRQSGWQRGKGLGGSSGINFLCWTKPPTEDVNDFERLGNPGWNWENFEKFVGRTEGFVEPSEEFKKTNGLSSENWKIGRQGPLALSFPATIDEGELKIQQTFVNSGLPWAKNPASYSPNKDRPNFTVLVSAHVHHVLTEKAQDGKLTAVGVAFEHGGKVHTVNASREVILSAGALKSPQLLELSGIGRKDVLEKIDVPLKLELPGVGENVQEHMFLGMSWELKEDVKFDTWDLLRDPTIAAEHLKLHTTGSGLYTTGIIGFAFTTLDKVTSRAEAIYESIKETVSKLDEKTSPPGLLDQYNILLERFKPGNGSPGCEFISFPGLFSFPNPPEPGKRYATTFVATNYTFSRGTIHSTSNDASKDPEFDAHYFEQDVDLEIFTEMCKFARKMADIAPLKDMIVKELNPGPEVQTHEQMREWVKSTFSTTWHTIGSCSLLPKEKGGVVDPDLKVYGTNNLRVADISVAPLHFGAHPQAMAYGIGEQAAEIIKGKFQA
ncbi:hypothetical protein PHLCEN_2v10431 [Hermanssonia centrifuga]|uniref:Glucose-methanol-choline oxidoreductase N-terminal domain-containing protein n=1 Tax=Hermanssonia centrifuga TaxID=98765 RepID=A0A2R6NN07_9APHY|nr:hypothetical protein PHLCEN_2v10431 [Hermanssonia centrifuga]